MAESDAQEQVLNYFLRVEITVKPGEMALFKFYAEELLEAFSKSGWQLLAACSSITGTPERVLHLWRIPDANALLLQMIAMGENKIYEKLSALCVEQKQELFTAMPYNPEGAGGKNIVPDPQPSPSARNAKVASAHRE